MKKLVVITSALLCLCLTVPVSAKVHVGGIVFLDAYYHRFDADAARALLNLAVYPDQTDDWQQLEIEVPNITRLNANWMNDDGNVGMFVELGLGGANGAAGVVLRHAYGWWQINPMFKLLVGHTDGSFATLNPSQMIGTHAQNLAANPIPHVIGLGFGNLYEARVPQIRLETRFNDMVSVKISAVDNRTNAPIVIAGNEENVWPRIDICVPLNFGPLYLEPGFSWAKGKHDEGSQNIGAGTSFDVWAAVLGIRYSIGPFTLTAEGTIGENLANDAYLRPLGVGIFNDINWDLHDSEDIAFFFDLAYKVGPAEIHAIYGYQSTDIYTWAQFISGDPAAPTIDLREGEIEFETQMLGLSIPITVARTFIIRPEIFYYDWGKRDAPNWPGLFDYPFGHEIIGGVQFQVVF
jgi:hypothetical protein